MCRDPRRASSLVAVFVERIGSLAGDQKRRGVAKLPDRDQVIFRFINGRDVRHPKVENWPAARRTFGAVENLVGMALTLKHKRNQTSTGLVTLRIAFLIDTYSRLA